MSLALIGLISSAGAMATLLVFDVIAKHKEKKS